MGRILSIVQGNNFGTAISIHAVDVEGHEIQDFSLAGSTDIRVWYLFAGKEVDVEAWTMEDGKIVIVWPKDITLGSYDIFIDGYFESTAWRNAMKSQFRIVKYNYEAYIPDDVIVLNGIYQLSAEMAIITRISGGGGTPSQTLPLMDGVAQVGTENAYARGDHRHPSDANKQDVIDDLAAIRSGAAAGATAYQKPSTGIPKTDMAQAVQQSLGKADTAVQPSAIADMATETYVDGEVQAEQTRAEGVEGGLQDALDAIEAVIPAAASSSNQLADKEFVNHSISTNTATFKGTYNSLAELQQVSATNNDYAFVIETDAVGNEYYDRYKYNGSQWIFEYKVESTPFTAAQWAAIQSGITSALVTKIGTALQPTDIIDSLNSTSTTAALSANQGKVLNDTKQPLIDSSHKLSADLVDDSSTTNKFVTASDKTTWNGKQDALVSGTNIKTINGSSVLGNGNLSTLTPVTNHGTSDTTFAVTPNTLHIWGTVASLTLTLATPTDNTIVNEYMFEFTSGSTPTTLSLPSGILWPKGNPLTSPEANTIYEVNIRNNKATWSSWEVTV